ncbi:MAG: cold shock domain-containing protein [Chloroflexota bacterium]
MRQLVQFQEELSVNYCKLVAVSADEPKVVGAYRFGLGASFPFLSDSECKVIDQLNIRDETEGEYMPCAIPMTFVLAPDLTIYKIYNGWFFVGRPTLEELRLDLRELMSRRSNYRYEVYNQPAIKNTIRIPADTWSDGVPKLGADGKPIAKGVVEWFSMNDGHGMIRRDNGDLIFLHFTAIPGEGYRTITVGARVAFEIVIGPRGHECAYNVQVLTPGERRG